MRTIGKRTFCLLLACAALLPAAAYAAPTGQPPVQFTTGDLPWGRVICGTMIVVGLICLGVFLLKKMGGGVLTARGRYMELLEVRPVARGVNLFLVRVAGRVVLLGSSGEHVTQLTEFPEDQLPSFDTEKEHVGLEGFRSLLSRLAGASR